MTLDLLSERGTPLERQRFSWRELTPRPYSKLDVDPFTRVRALLASAIEAEAVSFSHASARATPMLRAELARIRRLEQHQETLLRGLTPPDQSSLETSVALAQCAVEVTASIAVSEPDPALAALCRFFVLEDLDHLYRCAALLDRLEARDANTIVQSQTDIRPGRPVHVAHRHPDDDLHRPYDRRNATAGTKLHALVLLSVAERGREHTMTASPMHADPLARQLFAELASIQEQHVSAYESILDPDETCLEKWLLHEACEAYVYDACWASEPDANLRALWGRLLDYELGHVSHVMQLMRRLEGRDPTPLLRDLPARLEFASHRGFLRALLRGECDLRAELGSYVSAAHEHADAPSVLYRASMNIDGSPSDTIAAGYRWAPGTELTQRARIRANPRGLIG